MIRTNLYLTSEQRQFLMDLGKLEGNSMAEQVRLAIDEYLKAKKQQYQKRNKKVSSNG